MLRSQIPRCVRYGGETEGGLGGEIALRFSCCGAKTGIGDVLFQAVDSNAATDFCSRQNLPRKQQTTPKTKKIEKNITTATSCEFCWSVTKNLIVPFRFLGLLRQAKCTAKKHSQRAKRRLWALVSIVSNWAGWLRQGFEGRRA